MERAVTNPTRTPQRDKYHKPGNHNGEAVTDVQDPFKKVHP